MIIYRIRPGINFSGILDIKGGIGSASLSILPEHKHLGRVIIDMDDVSNNGIEVWLNSTLGAMSLRFLGYDWSPKNCGIFSRNARAIAGEEARLVIVNLVLARVCENETT
jgi:hypothetical protein